MLAAGLAVVASAECPAHAQSVPSTTSIAASQEGGPSFEQVLALVRAEAAARGVSAALLDRVLTGLTPDPEVPLLLNRQPEHERTVGAYVGALVSPQRIENGRSRLAELGQSTAALETLHGVDRHVLVAIWGVETSYGTSQGERQVIRSLATLAQADPRRPQFWRFELVAALRILQNGDIAPEAMTGSWAGAMGHTQFMPTTYLQHAVDFDRDGKRDIWRNVGDALASAANYLKASGWVSGQPWGIEVELPHGFDYGLSAPGRAKRASEWQALGVRRPAGTAWPATSGDLALILPAGAKGPAFLVGPNYRAILRYNASQAYALSIGLLADSLTSGQPPATRWPEGDKALSRSEREELQRLLAGLGHDVGGVDGIVGGQSRAAIRAFQRTQSMPEDGHPSTELLERLRTVKN